MSLGSRAKWKKTVEKLQNPEACLPGQEEQQSLGGREASEQARWQGTFSQLTSPSWGSRRTHVRTPRAAAPKASCTSSAPTERSKGRGGNAWPSPVVQVRPNTAGGLKETEMRKGLATSKVFWQAIQVEERQEEDGLILAKGLGSLRRDKRQKAAPGIAAPRSQAQLTWHVHWVQGSSSKVNTWPFATFLPS